MASSSSGHGNRSPAPDMPRGAGSISVSGMLVRMAAPVACRVLYANQLVIDQRWTWRLSDPFWRLYFNRDRGAWIARERRRWELPPHRAALVPAWGDFSGGCIGPVRHFYIHFETPGLS